MDYSAISYKKTLIRHEAIQTPSHNKRLPSRHSIQGKRRTALGNAARRVSTAFLPLAPYLLTSAPAFQVDGLLRHSLRVATSASLM